MSIISRNNLKELSPACFGMVMATGIISLVADVLDFRFVANSLFYINIFVYLVLWVATFTRLLLFRREFLFDIVDHERAPGFFTMAAGSSVLGSQCLILADNFTAGCTLLVVAMLLWLILTYTIFAALTIKKEKPTLDRGITGGWLLAVVATQSIAVLGVLVAGHFGSSWKLGIHFVALSMWLWGGMLYIWMIALIFYRYTFFRMSPGDLTPPYFINMGAMAISTLAGARLILSVSEAPFLASILPFLKGFCVFYWAAGTWWIPLLLILAIWKHLYRRFPLKYDSLYWGAVFPLGMYALGTYQMAVALDIHFLDFIPVSFFYLALLAWIVTLLGLLKTLVSKQQKVSI